MRPDPLWEYRENNIDELLLGFKDHLHPDEELELIMTAIGETDMTREFRERFDQYVEMRYWDYIAEYREHGYKGGVPR